MAAATLDKLAGSGPIEKGARMTATAEMIRTHPAQTGDSELLARCIDECLRCAQACTSCSDACVAEESVADLRYCIRVCADCSDICLATARIVSRLTEPNGNLLRAVLESCTIVCEECAAECRRHAEHGMTHCEVCAGACEQCATVCRQLESSFA